jgi:Holliday junction resolvasome RuvABC DNA-binding subunit
MKRTKQPASQVHLSNRQIGAALREIADHLQRGGDSPFRVAAYRRAAVSLARCEQDLNDILAREGEAGLRKLPGVGRSLARAIAGLVRRGRSAKLERLRKRDHGEALLRTLPGVGPRLAEQLEQTLGAGSLEDVFAAAYDGRLRRVPGVGAKRLRAIRESLGSRLQTGQFVPYSGGTREPPIADLLSVDEEYRAKAAAGRLPLAAPKRFNPTGRAWMPVLNTDRGGRAYTAHYANTARTHELGRVGDWVIIVCEAKEDFGQWTVITATRGELRGRRLVMHREAACRDHYRQQPLQLPLPLEPGDGE